MIDLWTQFTKENHIDFLLSLQLLGETQWPKEKQLACLYGLSNHAERHYRSHCLPKRDGTMRLLLAPDPLLKKVQRNILHHMLDGMAISNHATAYRKGVDILGNASPHCGQPQVLNMDIQDFFGSISFPMVYQAAFPYRLFPPSIGTMLTYLCCYEDYLPQGAPTSAAISNLVLKPFDDHMGDWCAQRKITYTRYCDDMTFSGRFETGQVENKVGSFLFSLGFAVNEKKNRRQKDSCRQSVTGIVVNEKPQVSRDYRDKLRQEVHYCMKYGVKSHLQQMNNPQHLPPETEQIARYLHSLQGRINYVLQVDPQNRFFREAKGSVGQLLFAHGK